jgi:eukaryotic-like serine/threonine-protein kinase
MSQLSQSQRLRPFKPVRFGRYTLLTPLAVGGMGEVFLARLEGALGFDKFCVIKKILPQYAQEDAFLERFINEAKILVKLSHGNIAQVLDMDVHETAPYIALEFVDGKDVRRLLGRLRDKGAVIPIDLALYLVIRVLDALAYAHRKLADDGSALNLVHRDVSPQNILISYEGEVKVIDFGLAKSTLSASKTNPSIVLGKFMYMAPEQARHQLVDKRSDIYALGLCLYELISQKSPFAEVPPGELMSVVGKPTIPRLDSVVPNCPSPVADVVARALEVSVESRFQTAEDFRTKLQEVLHAMNPAVGAESLSRFMHETFAIEYQAERRMLAHAKESVSVPDEEAIPNHSEKELAAVPSIVTSSVAKQSPVEVKRKSSIRLPAQRATAERATEKNEIPTRPSSPRVKTKPSPPQAVVRETSAAVAPSATQLDLAPPAIKSQSTAELPPVPVKNAPAKPKAASSALVWMVIPLLALAGVGAYVAYDMYSETLTANQLEQERKEHALATESEANRSREVQKAKVPGPEEETLEGLATATDSNKPKVPKVAPIVVPLSEGERAFRALKADVAKLSDDRVASSFTLRMTKFERELSTKKDDPAWIALVKSVQGEVRAKLQAQ